MAISSASLSMTLVPRASASRSSLSSSSSVFFSGNRTSFARKSSCVTVSRGRAPKGLKCNCLFGLGVPELVVIAGVVALVFGPKKLPEIGRSIGKTVRGFQQAAKEFETEIKKSSEESAESSPEQPVILSEGEKEKDQGLVSGTKEK